MVHSSVQATPRPFGSLMSLSQEQQQGARAGRLAAVERGLGTSLLQEQQQGARAALSAGWPVRGVRSGAC
jgi:hypothetical protein